MRRAVVPVLCLLVAACGGENGGGEDVVYLDVPWAFGPDQTGPDAGPLPDLPATPDILVPFDTPIPGDAPVPDDSVTPVDTPPSEDTVVPQDTPPPEDTQPLEDTNFDTGPCGGCPSDYPNCVNGECKCTPFSCTDGTYCKGGLCVPCTVDAHCGPDCLSCGSMGKFCAEDGSHCLECDPPMHGCPPGKLCVAEACTVCEGLGLCGDDCVQCSPELPVCADGGCVCNASSCPAEHACEAGVCLPCTVNDPDHCGPSCLACSGGTPHCQAGACAFCNTNGACGPACQACGGALGWCPPDGSGCVECFDDGHCAEGEHCGGAQTCVPNCAAQGCTSVTTSDADECSDAIIAGRLDAVDGGATFSGDTEDESNDDDLIQWGFPPSKCNDEGEDHFYRIWLRPGETLTVQLDVQDNYFDAMLKLYEGTECDEDDAGFFEDNDKYLVDCWDDGWEGDDESFSWTAVGEGWHTVVIDGREEYDYDAWPDDGDYGEYSITLSLTCTEENCCCE